MVYLTRCGNCILSKNMPVNLNQPQLWKADIAQSVDMYN